jgi:phage-related protein (TIGR01555 family)
MTKPVYRIPARMSDGLANIVSGQGTAADKSSYARYGYSYITPDQVEAAYRTSGLCRKIHDVPPYEMTREGRNWQADTTEITELEETERRLNVWGKIRAALTTARLFGGSALLLGLPGAASSPAPPPAKDALKYIVMVSRSQLRVGPLDMDVLSDGFGEPLYYEMVSNGRTVTIHPSRVIPFVGQPLPAGAMGYGTDGFWGDPLLMSIEAALKNVDSTNANVASLVHELKIDTIGIPGLTSSFENAEYEAALSKRLMVAKLFQSQFNVKLIDAAVTSGGDGETWETRQLAMTGYPDLMRAFQVFIAGVTDIPYTRLFGESPGGLNATGDGQQTDFNRMIRAKQKVELRPPLERLDEYLIPSVLGSRPSDVYWTFAPLEEADPEAESTIEKTYAETIQIYANSGAVPADVIPAMAKGRLIESGAWPGIETAYAESKRLASVEDIPEDGADDPNALVETATDLTEPAAV